MFNNFVIVALLVLSRVFCQAADDPYLFDELCGENSADDGSSISMKGWIPWHVVLVVESNSKTSYSCAATLLNDEWLLTLVRCLEINGSPVEKAYFIAEGGDVKKYQVQSTVKFPGYDPDTNDIALVQIEKIKFDDLVNMPPICIRPVPAPIGKVCIVSGWAMQQEPRTDDLGNGYLRRGHIEILNKTECEWLKPHQICIVVKEPVFISVIDSGSPVFCKEPWNGYISGKWYLEGLMPWRNYADTKAIFAIGHVISAFSIHSYLYWINEKTGVKVPDIPKFTVSLPDDLVAQVSKEFLIPCIVEFDHPNEAAKNVTWFHKKTIDDMEYGLDIVYAWKIIQESPIWNRYTFTGDDGMTLKSHWKERDRDLCCGVEAGEKEALWWEYSCLEDLQYRDFEPDQFQCVHDSLTFNGDTSIFKSRRAPTDTIRITCGYTKVYPSLDILVMDSITFEQLLTASGIEYPADYRPANRYNLTVQFESSVSRTVYIVFLFGKFDDVFNFRLELHIQDALNVTVREEVSAVEGENLVIPCDFSKEENMTFLKLTWKEREDNNSDVDSDDGIVYTYSLDGVEKPSTPSWRKDQDMTRYGRLNYSLIINEVQASDYRIKCCEIKLIDPLDLSTTKKQQCTKLDLDLLECASNPCKNAGTCLEGTSSFTCQCTDAYVGPTCDTHKNATINECASNPCENGGTCGDVINGYVCTCAPGFSRVNCDMDSANADGAGSQKDTGVSKGTAVGIGVAVAVLACLVAAVAAVTVYYRKKYLADKNDTDKLPTSHNEKK